MEENINIPFEKLAQECNIINPEHPKEVIDKIVALSSDYPSEYLVLIYNYFFEHSNSYEVLMFLLQKIDKYKDKSSRGILIDSLVMKGKLSQRISDTDNLTRIRVNITKALANTKDSQAVYPLLYCLNSKEENYKVKLSCAEALGFLKERALEALNKISFKGDRVFNALVKSLRDESPQVRINAIEVLMNSEDERAIDLIKGMLADPNREVVQNAVIALFNILGNGILSEIINDDKSPSIAKNEALKLQDDLREEEIEEAKEKDE